MTKLEKKQQDEASELSKFQERHDSIWTQGKIANSNLVDCRKQSGQELIGGADRESIASELAKREAKVGMFAGGARRWARS